MRLYAHLGQSLARSGASDRYGDWISSYADPSFEDLAARLENLLDRYGRPEAATAAAYRRAMQLELDFFDAWRDQIQPR
jgi:thiaminase (transcriptional activator TenA)